MNLSVILLSTVSVIATLSAAQAQSLGTPSEGAVMQSILSTMGASGGSESAQWQIAPSYSELSGLGVRGAVGGQLSDGFALGAIVDYAEHREEYLANAGIRLNDMMRFIGTIGILKESKEFRLGDGRQDVSQLQYGLSLKGDYEAGVVRGFEINAYATDASTEAASVETGNLKGLQLVTRLAPSEASSLRLGVGYERAEWDGGEVTEGLTLQGIGSQRLSDSLSLNYTGKMAETETVVGLGLTYDMASDGRSNALSVNFEQIKGKHSLNDDRRLSLSWTIGLGGGASGSASGGGSVASDMTASSQRSLARPDLLAEVMTRPAFLPQRVLARSAEGADAGGACAGVTPIVLSIEFGSGSNGDDLSSISAFSANRIELAVLQAAANEAEFIATDTASVEVAVRPISQVGSYGPTQTVTADLVPIEGFNGSLDGYFINFNAPYVVSANSVGIDVILTIENSEGCTVISGEFINFTF